MSISAAAPPAALPVRTPPAGGARCWDLTAVPAVVRRHAAQILAEVALGDDALVHHSTQCPLATAGTRRPVPLEDLSVLAVCSLCAPLQHTVALSGPPAPTHLARLAFAAAQLAGCLRAAERGDHPALANAGLVAASAAAAQRNLSAAATAAPTSAAAQAAVLASALRTLERLRARYHHGLGVEVLRRWMVGPDGPFDEGADVPGLGPAAWRAARWAVRNGCDPHMAAGLHLRPRGHAALRTWLAQLGDAAREAAAAPEHAVVVAPAAATEGARADTLAALGFSLTGARPSARMVPALLAETFEPGFPGVRIGDAGPCPPNANTRLGEVLEALSGLWQPGSDGPLQRAPVALDAALGILDPTA